MSSDDLRPRGERRVVERELAIDRLEVAQRRPFRPFAGAGVEQVDQQARPLEVAQEPIAEPGARVRALDEARDVGDDEAPLVGEADHAQVGDQRGERVVGDLRPRG